MHGYFWFGLANSLRVLLLFKRERKIVSYDYGCAANSAHDDCSDRVLIVRMRICGASFCFIYTCWKKFFQLLLSPFAYLHQFHYFVHCLSKTWFWQCQFDIIKTVVFLQNTSDALKHRMVYCFISLYRGSMIFGNKAHLVFKTSSDCKPIFDLLI